ncbi:MAG: phosphoribosylglycinamide formyltransferase [Thaumarchaeota archaeon]|nr:phosphoribosylglycinamide formyltransferase [Nitrososphaerota archaeon]
MFGYISSVRHGYYCGIIGSIELEEMKIAILVSGNGTGLQAIIDHIRLGVLLNTRIVKIVSNSPTARALIRGFDAGIESVFVEGVAGKKYSSSAERERERLLFDDRVSSMLLRNGVELVICAGFNQVLSDLFVNRYMNKIMNVHPAYNIEKFGGVGMVGLRVHQAVINTRERISGCTIHYVNSTIDRGPVIMRAKVPVFVNDTPERLGDRVSVIEHRTYPKAIQLHIDKRISVYGNNVILDLGEEWEDDWNRRQEQYIMYQTQMWKRAGKNIDGLFKHINS